MRPLDYLRWAAGLVFVIFGIGKFVKHDAETRSFDHYGLPEPSTFVYAIGVLEIVGGLLLIAGFRVREVAFVMAGNMVAAIALSGIAKGETISLTVAPALLAVMVLLVIRGRRTET